MSDQWGQEDDSTSQNTGQTNDTSPKALREAYEAMKAKLDQVSEELTSERTARQEEKLQSVFSSHGVPDEVRQHYTGEKNPEKAEEWIATMKSAFGGESAPQSAPQPSMAAETQAQYRQMTEAGATGAPLTGDQAAQSAISQASSVQEIMQAMQQIGR